jgi:hypothetical protein
MNSVNALKLSVVTQQNILFVKRVRFRMESLLLTFANNHELYHDLNTGLNCVTAMVVNGHVT